MPCASKPPSPRSPASSAPTSSTRSSPVARRSVRRRRQRVDEHQGVVAVEQVVGQVHAADAVVDDPDTRPAPARRRAGGRPRGRSRRRRGTGCRCRRPGWRRSPHAPPSSPRGTPAMCAGPTPSSSAGASPSDCAAGCSSAGEAVAPPGVAPGSGAFDRRRPSTGSVAPPTLAPPWSFAPRCVGSLRLSSPSACGQVGCTLADRSLRVDRGVVVVLRGSGRPVGRATGGLVRPGVARARRPALFLRLLLEVRARCLQSSPLLSRRAATSAASSGSA